ncbi:protein transport protein S31 [Ceratobasidium sp. 423]|nr:protein transport protein S31 [Ceratobasidium sp. 423]
MSLTRPRLGADTISSETKRNHRHWVNLLSRYVISLFSFNRLAWGYVDPDCWQEVSATGSESAQNKTDPVRALHYNPLQTSLLASGSVGSELYTWDLENPSTPYTPGARSQHLDGVSALAWNAQVAHILASSSLSGYTVVWDLRGKREVVALQYGGGGGPVGGPGASQGIGGVRRGMSDVAWHPDNATRLITPQRTTRNLRNTRAPENIPPGYGDTSTGYITPASTGTYGALATAPSGTAPSSPYGAPASGPYAGTTRHPSTGPYGAPPSPAPGPYGAPPAPSTGPYGTPSAPPGPYPPPPLSEQNSINTSNGMNGNRDVQRARPTSVVATELV